MTSRLEYLRDASGTTEEELAYVTSINLLKRSSIRRQATLAEQLSKILDSWLFQGNWKQASNDDLLGSCSITHIVNVTDQVLLNRTQKILHLSSPNGHLADLSSYFEQSNAFLDACREEKGRALFHCERGGSRSSTIVLAYLIHHKKCLLNETFVHLLDKRLQASPNHVLLLQLARYEKQQRSS